MDDSASREVADFMAFFYGDTDAWVYTPLAIGITERPIWKPFMWHWPRQGKSLVNLIIENAANPEVNVFFSPAMFREPTPRKDKVLGARVLWCDYDGNAPEGWPENPPAEDVLRALYVPPPTLRVQSSFPGHEHVYWALDEFVTDVDWLDDRNRAIAYATHADTSGWDSNQVLRPPHTVNRKPGRKAMPVQVLVWEQ